ncbi:MAG: DUF177 domain-containing protein [Nitrospirae bacterium]|nr:DUF177 domain-containing protein [Nitrospirota bacterium]
MMIVRLKDIKDEGLVVELNMGVSLDTAKVKGPVRGNLSVDKSGDSVLINGTARLEMTLTCSRCLREFDSDLEVAINLTYMPWQDDDLEERDLQETDMDIGFYTNDEIDIHQLVTEQILLNMPMKIVCRDTCMGLCHTCGANLNEGPCRCSNGPATVGSDPINSTVGSQECPGAVKNESDPATVRSESDPATVRSESDQYPQGKAELTTEGSLVSYLDRLRSKYKVR